MLRLAFGSFIVAILVGAYNQVVMLEAELDRERERDMSLPPGYDDKSAYGAHAVLGNCRRFVLYVFTSKSFGMKHDELLEKLEAEIDKKEEQGWSAATRRQAELQQAAAKMQKGRMQPQAGMQQQQGGWQQKASGFAHGALHRAGQAGTALRLVNDLANGTSERQVMLDSAQLVALVGPHTAQLLLRTYGADPPDGGVEAGDSALPSLAMNGFAGDMAGASADLLVNPAADLIGQYGQGASGLLEGVDSSLLGGVGSSILGGVWQRVSVPGSVLLPAPPLGSPMRKEQRQQPAGVPPPPAPVGDHRDALL